MKPRSQWESCLTLAKGAGYTYLRLSYKKWFSLLSDLADHVIFVAHVKDSMTEKNGKEVTISDLALTGKVKEITAKNADAIGYVYWEKEQLMISFSSQDGAEANSRCEHLKNRVMPFVWKDIFVD